MFATFAPSLVLSVLFCFVLFSFRLIILKPTRQSFVLYVIVYLCWPHLCLFMFFFFDAVASYFINSN